MAQTNEQSVTGRSSNPLILCNEACKADNISLMEQAISIATKTTSSHAVQDVLQRGLRRSAARGAVQVLKFLLEPHRGTDVAALRASAIMANDDRAPPSQEILEILVDHGWDINTQDPADAHDRPLLWHVVEDPDLVRWCLGHGARVDILDSGTRDKDGAESRTGAPRQTILGLVASTGSVETFNLLQSEGAPLDPRALHKAVEQATMLAPKEGAVPSPSYIQRMDMVRHLVSDIKVDVNAVQPQLGRQCSTPLCIVAGRPTNRRPRELVHFLLDHGADPNLNCKTQDDTNLPSAMECALTSRNLLFLQDVKDWEEEKQVNKHDEQAGCERASAVTSPDGKLL